MKNYILFQSDSLQKTVLNLMKLAKFSKMVENTAGKGEIACYKKLLLFPQCFKRLILQMSKFKGLFWERDKHANDSSRKLTIYKIEAVHLQLLDI